MNFRLLDKKRCQRFLYKLILINRLRMICYKKGKQDVVQVLKHFAENAK